MEGAEELRLELSRHKLPGRRRYPEKLRAQVGQWVTRAEAAGQSRREIVAALDMPWQTLQSWAARHAKDTAALLLPVTIHDDGALDGLEPSLAKELVLITRAGHRVEGLHFDQLTQLLQVLS